MTTNQLKYFVTAAKCLNFTEAGRQHYISQTAITQHIQALEEQLGVKLFSREKRKVELTPAGKVFLEEARAILERIRIASEKTEKATANRYNNNNPQRTYIKRHTHNLRCKQITVKLLHDKQYN